MSDRAAWMVDRRAVGAAFWTFLPVIYFLSALPIVIFLAFFRQPIGVADEWSHIARAAQLADGHLFTQFAEPGKRPLGSMDPFFQKLTVDVHSRRHEAMGTLLPSLEPLRWSKERILANYNSSVYFPVPFLLSTAVLKFGMLAGSGIVETLRIVNLLNGLLCLALTALAIATTPRGKAVIFVVGILPMSLFLFASASPDGPLIGSGLLAFALLSRCLVKQESSAGDFVVMAILATVVVATKLPYLPVFVVVIAGLWLGSAPWHRPHPAVPVLAALVVIAISVGWSVVTKAGSVDVTWGAATGNPSGQVEFLLRHPGASLLLAWNTLAHYGWAYLHQLVGNLGWLDAPISTTGAHLLLGALVLSLGLDGVADRLGIVQLAVLIGLLAGCGAVFVGLYVATNPVGSLAPIEGVQGRYFLPLLAFVAVLVPVARSSGWRRSLLAIVLIASVPIAEFETMRTVIERYYA